MTVDTDTEGYPDRRVDSVWVVVTVLKTKNNYSLRKTEPKKGSLGTSQYAFKMTFELDLSEWFNRVVDLEFNYRLTPPEASKFKMTFVDGKFGPTISETVLDRMTDTK